jgi:tetratricopeptide (TPR) repeat protein
VIDATDGSHLVGALRREMADVFAVQDEIAGAIAGELRGKLAGTAPRKRVYTPDLPAYQAYLRRQYEKAKYTPEGWSRARQFYGEAIALDPLYVEPRMSLAELRGNLVIEGLRPARELLPGIRAEAKKALELDSSNPAAHSLLGFIAATYDYNWREADARFCQAMAEAPEDIRIRIRYCGLYAAPFLGNYRCALEALERAFQQDPLLVFQRAALCHFLVFTEKHDRAALEARMALEIGDHWLLRYAMAESYGSAGYSPRRSLRPRRRTGWRRGVTGVLAGVLHLMDRRGEAGELVAKLAQMAPFGMTLYHLLVSDIDAAADSFENSIDQREPFVVLYARAPVLRPLRESPRWPALAKLMNLPATV